MRQLSPSQLALSRLPPHHPCSVCVAANGVLNVMDAVLAPPAEVVSTAETVPEASRAACSRPGLVEIPSKDRRAGSCSQTLCMEAGVEAGVALRVTWRCPPLG